MCLVDTHLAMADNPRKRDSLPDRLRIDIGSTGEDCFLEAGSTAKLFQKANIPDVRIEA